MIEPWLVLSGASVAAFGVSALKNHRTARALQRPLSQASAISAFELFWDLGHGPRAIRFMEDHGLIPERDQDLPATQKALQTQVDLAGGYLRLVAKVSGSPCPAAMRHLAALTVDAGPIPGTIAQEERAAGGFAGLLHEELRLLHAFYRSRYPDLEGAAVHQAPIEETLALWMRQAADRASRARDPSLALEGKRGERCLYSLAAERYARREKSVRKELGRLTRRIRQYEKAARYASAGFLVYRNGHVLLPQAHATSQVMLSRVSHRMHDVLRSLDVSRTYMLTAQSTDAGDHSPDAGRS